jgi:cellulose synthase/poly-beta-1,6-N-acetylglucosamine synthase-like glycosyltransferase
MPATETVLLFGFYALIAPTLVLTLIITIRQAIFSLAAISLPPSNTRPQKQTAMPDEALPKVGVIVPAHNEEKVIADVLRALLQSDYPRDKLRIIVVNDRSTDGTAGIIDHFAGQSSILVPLHRPASAAPGKPAALKDAIAHSEADVFVFFDADYLPSPSLIRDLVAPFADAKVGATMGRVVPVNSSENLLTRLIDLERRAGYVVDQQMRERWRLLPQFGGTVGAVRTEALAAVGGWRVGLMTEDTYLTYALFLAGYEVAYVNHAACYEESPETWLVRYKQVRRWAYGHNECLGQFLRKVLFAPGRRITQRMDAAIILLFYLYPVMSLTAMSLSVLAPALVGADPAWMLVSLVPLLCGFGNLAPFFQIIVAATKDRQPQVLAALPLLPISSVLNMLASSHGFLQLLYNQLLRRKPHWDKTSRFRADDFRACPGRAVGAWQAVENKTFRRPATAYWDRLSLRTKTARKSSIRLSDINKSAPDRRQQMFNALLLACFLVMNISLVTGALVLLLRKARDPVYPIPNSQRRSKFEKGKAS